MTSRSNLSLLSAALLGGLAFGIVGCGSGDIAAANTEKVDKEAAAKLQPGANGSKAAHGGGIDEGPMPAQAGEKTGMLQGGRK